MARGSLIIRLIDIVLILLFGFLAISEIEKKSPIKLPQSNVKVKSQVDKEELLVVGLRKGKDNKLEIIIEGKNIPVPDFATLEEIIYSEKKKYKEMGREMRVRVRSNWDLPIKYTMRIADFCQQENIPAGMDVHTVVMNKK